MLAQEIIKIVNEKRRIRAHEGIRKALFYRLYKLGLNGCDIASLFGYRRPSAYNAIYSHRNLLEVKDKKAIEADEEISLHEITVEPIINMLKIEGYEIRIDGELLVINSIKE